MKAIQDKDIATTGSSRIEVMAEGGRTAAPLDAETVPGVLGVAAAGLSFRNPIVLAAGTAAYGREVAEVINLDRLGGIATKAVSLEPRHGAPPLRVGEFPGGMINAVGLANPGVESVVRNDLPWLARNAGATRVLVNVVGFAVEEFAAVVERMDEAEGHDGYELNVSCPNVKAGGLEFGASPESLRQVVERARAATRRPLFVKLSPASADIVGAARIAVEAGADGLTLVNTLPGLVVDVERCRPALGFGTGGVSGRALMPAGVLATWKVHSARLGVPIAGLGGVESGTDALQYIMAGASLVGIGTAALRDPRAPERVVKELRAWCEKRGVRNIQDLAGSLEWPS